ncbi:MAG: amidohydrolase family protein [Muribaculaceae bacterium]|nr:amidohydrolase family protein [Muribaculaceae bacterium]
MRRLYHNAVLVNEGRMSRGYLVALGDIIESVGAGEAPSEFLNDADIEAIDCRGGLLMPGVIDTHVHFREPGMTDKASIRSESRAALSGGVTSFIDMPNTKPPTVSREALADKMERASRDSTINYAFFIGATDTNLLELLDADYTHTAGIKLFLGSSTGGMLVDDKDTLSHIFAQAPAIIAVHAEDEAIITAARERLKAEYPDGIPVEIHTDVRPREACIAATRLAIELAEKWDKRVHICHISTADELRLIAEAKARGVKVTAETCPQYLIFDRTDFLTLGSRVKCNPAIKDASDRIALLRALRPGGAIDTIATDHAPHLLSQKEGDALTAASGMPMVQFSLPAMLDLISTDPEAEEMVSPAQIVELMCHAPARIFGIERRGFLRPGYYADLVLAERLPLPGHKVTDADTMSLCGWTPLAGRVLGWKATTLSHTAMPLVFRGNLNNHE